MKTTDWVRQALTELGQEVSNQAVKNYIKDREPTVPEGQVSLALHKFRKIAGISEIKNDKRHTKNLAQKIFL